MLAPCLELSPQLTEALLALTGKLLELHQLLLNVVEVTREIAPELAYRSPAVGERIHDPLLQLNDLRELRGTGRVAACRLRLEQGNVILHLLNIALRHTPTHTSHHPESE